MMLTWRTRARAALVALLVAVTGLAVVTVQPAASAATMGSGYAPANPARLLDTRSGVGAPVGRLAAGGTVSVQVTGQAGIPANGVAAVAVNVTAVAPTSAGFLTVYPGGTRPAASNVNVGAGQTVANFAVVKLSATGRVTVYSSAAADVLLDVLGWFPTGSDLRPVTPVRTLDTRTGLGATTGPVRGGTSLALQVTGRTGVPSSGVGAVLLNVTAVAPAAAGFVTAYPTGSAVPQASTLNHASGQTRSGFVVAKVGTGGRVSLYSKATAHLVVDVSGWFPIGSTYTPLTPSRVLDTRTGTGAAKGRVPAGGSVTVQVGGVAGVAPGADVAFVTVTALNGARAGFATAFPASTLRPGTSTVNFGAGGPVSNASLARLGPDGRLTIHTSQAADLVVDVAGWVPDTDPPARVTGLDLLARADTSVDLGWVNPPDPGLAQVVVRRAEGGTPPASMTAGTAVPLATPTASSVVDAGLTPGTTYSYSVFAIDGAGNVAPTPSTVVANPVTGVLTVSDAGQQTTWTAGFGAAAAGSAVTLQVRSIVTTMTDEVRQAAWRNIGTAFADGSGVARIVDLDPLAVSHTYRAVTGTGSTLTLSSTLDHAAVRTTAGTGLATVHLDTNEAGPILDRTTYLEGRLTIVPGDTSAPCGTTPVTSALLKTRGRGNSTWSWPKKPYNFTLDQKADLCGLGSNKKWALLASYFDKSLLRTGVAMDVGRDLTNLAWTPKQVPVDFYLNGRYQGSYVLIERVGIATNRVNVTALKNNQGGVNDAPPAVTGGYLLEWDFRAGSDHNVQVGPNGVRGWVGIKEPEDEVDGSGITPAQVAWVDGYLDTVDATLFGPGFADPVTGWRRYIDEASAVDYYIAQEVTKPIDGAFGSSVYMAKARDTGVGIGAEGKLFMGPMWDYDIAMGDYDTLGDKVRPDTWLLRDPLGPGTGQSDVNWFNRMMQDPTFVAAVRARWAVVKPALLTTADTFIPAQSGLIATSAEANFTRWDVFEQTWPGQVVHGSWSAEVSGLQDWLRARIAWMDGQLAP